MDKKVIFAVAGAGKTSYIIDSLNQDKRALIITYTENNFHHLKQRIIKKFGLIPENITVLTYYTFLYSFCYKPFLHDKYESKGINWKYPPKFTFRLNRSDKRYYLDSSGFLYSNRIAKLIDQEHTVEHVLNRLNKYYDQFFVDEVQDFGGHDFNLLKALCAAALEITLVGDFYQHTFDTSNDGQVNTNLHKDFEVYKANFQDVGLTIDTKTLSHSYRCTPDVCEFITENLGINIQSHKRATSNVSLITDDEEINEKFFCDKIVKLFYQNHMKYPCYSQNWGKSKGLDHFDDVCIMLNQTSMKAFNKGALKSMNASSKNKLYVACTRANNDLYFIEEKRVQNFKC